MLCAACVSIFASPIEEAWLRGPHHHSEGNLEKAAKNGCYLCTELLKDYVESRDATQIDLHPLASSPNINFHAQQKLEKQHAFTTFHLRQVTNDYGDLYFWFEDAQLSSKTFFLIRNHGLQEPSNHGRYLQAVRQDLDSTPWLVRDDGFDLSAHQLASSTGEHAIADLASRWLERCLRQHSVCNSSVSCDETGWSPKRLLKIDGDRLRLVLTEQTPHTGRYATLSHCWGPDPHICCLNADNLEAWQSDIPLHLLTRTFRDAILTTGRVNIEYLWIDSLCILQSGPGSREDWLEHAAAMRSVYRNSTLNIAVARASSGEEGAFASRSPTVVQPCHVHWRPQAWEYLQDPVARKGGVSQAEIAAGEQRTPIWTIRSIYRHSSACLRTLPLYTRAWVVQERFLAPRVLHFGDDRVMWECREMGLVDESCPDGIPEYAGPDWKPDQWPFTLRSVDDPVRSATATEMGDPTRKMWQDMIDEFTRCDLSFPDKDVFVAFAGIAEVFGQYYDHQYVAGFFRRHLPFALWWQNEGVRAVTNRAPTWSWASIDGQTKTYTQTDCLPCDRCCTPLADVEDVRLDLVDRQNIYGQIESAELTLRGRLMPCMIEKARQSGTGVAQTVVLFPTLSVDDRLPARYIIENKIRLDIRDHDLVYGLSELDSGEESWQSITNSTRPVFDRWAVPLFLSTIAKKGLKSEDSRHFGILVKQSGDGRYARVASILSEISTRKRFCTSGSHYRVFAWYEVDRGAGLSI